MIKWMKIRLVEANMMEVIQQYSTTILIFGLMGGLSLFQLLVADVAGIKANHKPGYPIEADYQRFIFRASRAYSNTNETVATFILLGLFGILSLADAQNLNTFAVVYFVGRVAHMFFYYANISFLRSASFVLALVGLIGMFVIDMLVWL
jgi:uncharacterized MAPEG superfamily protein